MRINFIFFITSTIIFVLSVIAICCAPIINKISNLDDWKSHNCDIISDLESLDEIKLKDLENYRYLKNLCRRQKAMYNLEYSSLIITVSLSFVCFYLSLLLRLNIGREFKNKIGFFGFISGIICFILILVYVCYSGYIFNNDIAFGRINFNNLEGLDKTNSILKLFPNGASYKWSKDKYISVYEEDSGDYSNYIKYKDLGDKRYNYNSDIYKKMEENDPCISNAKPSSYKISCDYIFKETSFDISNEYLYNRWITTLVLSCFIFIFNICLSIFGFLMFKERVEVLTNIVNSSPNVIQFTSKNNNNNELNLNNNINNLYS